MEQVANGRWEAVINLEAGKEYQYRYLVNGAHWFNDPDADRYVAHAYGGENSIVAT